MKVNWYAMVSLIFFNLVFVFGLAIGIYALLASLWVIMGTFIISPLLLFSVNILRIQAFSIFQSTASFLLFFVGVALFPVCLKVTKFLVKVSLDYINYNKKIIYRENI